MTRSAALTLVLAAALGATGCGAHRHGAARVVGSPTHTTATVPSGPSGNPSAGPSRRPGSSPSAGPRPTAAATRAPVAQRGDGRLHPVAGGSSRSGHGPLRRYSVQVEGGLGVDPAAFARIVESTLADARSWGADVRLSFRRVESGPVDFRVSLASPDTTDRLCRPLRTNGRYSCGAGSRAVINLRRWLTGADAYDGDLARYRQYVVNHEVGHTLGHSHESCPGAGQPAPVMMQQTKGVGACRPNPWPFPEEDAAG